MGAMKGDFLGFTFDGIHSSELGIMRVSDGSRYSENLLPTFQDKTVQIPGNNGMYYHGSYYTQRQFNLSIAFDALTEEQLRHLKVLFSDKKIHNLIFDEMPYKIYKVKITGTPNLKYVCFDKERPSYWNINDKRDLIGSKKDLYDPYDKADYGRVYKGEGQLNFVAYSPFAKSRFKYIDQYNIENIPEWGSLKTPYAQDVNYNLDSWIDSVKLLKFGVKKAVNGKDYILDSYTKDGILVYNPGDFDTDYILQFFPEESSGIYNFCRHTIQFDIDHFLKIAPLTLFHGDKGIQVNTKLNLLEGINEEGNITGTIYNQYIEEGDFFKIPVSDEVQFLNFIYDLNIEPQIKQGQIIYDYLFI